MKENIKREMLIECILYRMNLYNQLLEEEKERAKRCTNIISISGLGEDKLTFEVVETANIKHYKKQLEILKELYKGL